MSSAWCSVQCMTFENAVFDGTKVKNGNTDGELLGATLSGTGAPFSKLRCSVRGLFPKSKKRRKSTQRSSTKLKVRLSILISIVNQYRTGKQVIPSTNRTEH